jgi:Zn-dependent protease with chaperone function
VADTTDSQAQNADDDTPAVEPAPGGETVAGSGNGKQLAEQAGRWSAAVGGVATVFVVGSIAGWVAGLVLTVLFVAAGAALAGVAALRGSYVARAFRVHAPTPPEAQTLAGPVGSLARAISLESGDLPVLVQDAESVTARPVPGAIAVTTQALRLTPEHLTGVLAHEAAHFSGGSLDQVAHFLSLPARWATTGLFWLVCWPAIAITTLKGKVLAQIGLGLAVLFIWIPFGLFTAISVIGNITDDLGPLGSLPLTLLVGAGLRIWWCRQRELHADQGAVDLGFGEPLVDLLRQRIAAGWDDHARRRPWWRRLRDLHPTDAGRLRALSAAPVSEAARDTDNLTSAELVAAYPWMDGDADGDGEADVPAVLLQVVTDPTTAPIDRIRLRHAVELADVDAKVRTRFLDEMPRLGIDAMLHSSGLRLLPDLHPVHDLLDREVGVGLVAGTEQNSAVGAPLVEINHRMLRTSMLVIGPPGSGKTHSFAFPIVENLSQSALVGTASVVVLDPKGDDFDQDGWFDIVVDPMNPTHGLSLFGGSANADIAADRLASALLPPEVSDDKAYFVDASKNALYDCLAPYHAAFDAWPSVKELLGLLRGDQSVHDKVKAALKGKPDAAEWRSRLDARVKQMSGSHDPAASLVERFAQLDRPAIRGILDHANPFAMADINTPIRVRIALPESEYPEASRVLARLVVSQFVQTAGANDANPHIFKGLVIDEAGRYVDDYVARGIQRLRSKNAGLLLLTQTLADFPEKIRPTIFGSAGCKAVFGGVDPATAEEFSKWFGETWITETTTSRGLQTGQSEGRGHSHGTILDPQLRSSQSWQTTHAATQSVSTRMVERAVWTPSDIMTKVPTGHSVIALAATDGQRVGPLLVNHRAAIRQIDA